MTFLLVRNRRQQKNSDPLIRDQYLSTDLRRLLTSLFTRLSSKPMTQKNSNPAPEEVGSVTLRPNR
jgi:hypothetical protein